MSKATNRFPTETMVRMRMPPGSGSFSARGFEVTPDKDGCVELPNDLVSEAISHGLTVAQPDEGAKK